MLAFTLTSCLQGEGEESSGVPASDPSSDSTLKANEEQYSNPEANNTQNGIPQHTVRYDLSGVSQDHCVSLFYFNSSAHSPAGACYTNLDEQILIDTQSSIQVVQNSGSNTVSASLDEGNYEVVVVGQPLSGSSCPQALNLNQGNTTVLARDFGYFSAEINKVLNLDEDSSEVIEECENL